MSNLTIPVIAGPLPAGYCATSAQGYLADIAALMSITIPGGSMFYIGSSAPPPDLGYAIWVRTNPDGSMEGIYIFSGAWRRPHPVPPSSQSVWIWKGIEGDVWKFDGGDGTDPRPFLPDGVTPNPTYIAPTDTTGAMWMVDHDFDFRMPVGPGTNTVQYPVTAIDGTVTTPAATIINPGDVGGEEQHYIQADETGGADHVHVLASESAPGIASCYFRYDLGLTVDPFDGTLFDQVKGTNNPYNNSGNTNSYIVSNPATKTPGSAQALSAHQNMPPYRGAFFIKRTARKDYTAA
jgi:hypothetical protein